MSRTLKQRDTLVNPADSASFAPRAAALRGHDLVRGLAATPPYSASSLASGVTVTESTTAASGQTRNYGYADARFKWNAWVDTSGGSAVPRGTTQTNGVRHSSVPYATMSYSADDDHSLQIKGISGIQYRVIVDGKFHAAGMVTATTATGSNMYLQIGIGGHTAGVLHDVTVEFVSENGAIQFYGAYIAPTSTLAAPKYSTFRGMWVGDSYGLGIGSTSKAYGFATAVGRLLGCADFWTPQTSVSSTGLVQAASSLDGPYITRISDVISNAPDLVVIAGSLNDNPWVGQNKIGPALAAYYGALKAAVPNVTVVTTSPMYVADPPTAYKQVRDEMQAAAANLRIPFVDLFTPQRFYGSGTTAAPSGVGNSDYYLGGYNDPSHLHPSDAGHFALAGMLAPEIARAAGIL